MAFVHFGGSPKPKIGINPETEMGTFLIAYATLGTIRINFAFGVKFV